MADLTEHDAAFLGGWPAIEWRQPITVRTMNGDNETGCHDVKSAPSIWRRTRHGALCRGPNVSDDWLEYFGAIVRCQSNQWHVLRSLLSSLRPGKVLLQPDAEHRPKVTLNAGRNSSMRSARSRSPRPRPYRRARHM